MEGSTFSKLRWTISITIVTILVLKVQADTVTIEAATKSPIFAGNRYTGSHVGPFHMFRSSAKNAEIVNKNFKGQPVIRTFGLAFGDEYPKLRDDIINRKLMQKRGQPFSTFRNTMEAMAIDSNWHYDMENNKVEKSDPYLRPTKVFINSLRDGFAKGYMRPSGSVAPFRIDINTPIRKV